jgi:hypothetical protein
MRDSLYNLLPVIYRQKDEESTQGKPLKAYLDILESVSEALELDIDSLYDDWFIETCQDRIIPWIGELVGTGLTVGDDHFLPSYRTYVANTLAYRRRKGTAAILARAVQDLTGWEATVVEFFDSLSITQSLSLQDVGEGGTVSIRNVAASEWVDSPFNSLSSRSVDIRTQNIISNADGMSNCAPHIDPEVGIGLNSLGIYIARLRSYPIFQGMPSRHQSTTNGYTFNPLGLSAPLYNLPTTLRTLTDMHSESTMSLPLRRSVLEAEWLERTKTNIWSGPGYLGDIPAFQIWISDRNGLPYRLHSAELAIRDLTHWHYPEEGSGVLAFVDPELGRFTLAKPYPVKTIRTSYNYGFSADIGGGAYNRSIETSRAVHPFWTASVSASITTSRFPYYASLTEAIEAWKESGQSGQINILDSASYAMLDSPLLLDAQLLCINAVNGQRPCLYGRLSVKGLSNGGALTLNGCLLKSSLQIDGNLRVTLQDCTLAPKAGRSSIQGTPIIIPNSQSDTSFDVHGLAITIQKCIIGGMYFATTGDVHLEITDSIIDGGDLAAIRCDNHHASAKTHTTITASFQRSTVLGSVQIANLASAVDSIFTEPLHVSRRNQGYLCFCFVPNGSTTPVRYRCQPDLAFETAKNTSEAQEAVLLKLKPVFNDTRYGMPSYGQLGLRCPIEIRSGAENGSEMGAFRQLNAVLREQGLKRALKEYLPYGLDAEVFCMT